MGASETNSETLCAYICISVYRSLLFFTRYRVIYFDTSPLPFFIITIIDTIIVIEMYFLLALDFVPLFLYENRFT